MKITVENRQKKVPIRKAATAALKAAIRNCLSRQQPDQYGQIAVTIVDDARISALNQEFMGNAYPTDVLAFDNSFSGLPRQIDIIISAETAARNCRTYRTTSEREILLYAVHGMLHTLGYDDHTAAGRRRMQSKSQKILRVTTHR